MVRRKRGAARGSYDEEDTVKILEVCWDFSWKFFLDQTKKFWDIDTVQTNRVNCTETVEPIGALQRNGRSEGITLHCIYMEIKFLQVLSGMWKSGMNKELGFGTPGSH